MRTTTVFHECAEILKDRVKAHWAEKQPQLEELLVHCTAEEQELDLTIQHRPQWNRYEVRAVLRSPTFTLTIDESDQDALATVDHVADALEQAVQQHREWTPRELNVKEVDVVDIASADSFPASDAPCWTASIAGDPASQEEKAT